MESFLITRVELDLESSNWLLIFLYFYFLDYIITVSYCTQQYIYICFFNYASTYNKCNTTKLKKFTIQFDTTDDLNHMRCPATQFPLGGVSLIRTQVVVDSTRLFTLGFQPIRRVMARFEQLGSPSHSSKATLRETFHQGPSPLYSSNVHMKR